MTGRQTQDSLIQKAFIAGMRASADILEKEADGMLTESARKALHEASRKISGAARNMEVGLLKLAGGDEGKCG